MDPGKYRARYPEYTNGFPTKYRAAGWKEESYSYTPSGRLLTRSYTGKTINQNEEEEEVTLQTTYRYLSDNTSRLLTENSKSKQSKDFLRLRSVYAAF